MKYPSKTELKKMNKLLMKAEPTIVLGPHAPPAIKFRWDLCQKIVSYKIKNKLSQSELAKKLDIDPARVSEIVRHRVDKVSTDKLLEYVEIIEPNVKFKIA